jgi:hypothetical protein
MPTEVKGAIELRKALRKIQPELAKESNKEIAALLRVVTTKAKGFVPSQAPLSGWGKATGLWKNRVFNTSNIKSGIGYSAAPSKPNKSGFRSLATIFNQSAAGAIYEIAGRKNSQGLPPAKKVIGWTGGAFGKGRIGQVWETGRDVNKSANPNAGRQFIDALPELVDSQSAGAAGRRTHKTKGRLIFKAWALDQGRTKAAVLKAMDRSIETSIVAIKNTNINFRGR